MTSDWDKTDPIIGRHPDRPVSLYMTPSRSPWGVFRGFDVYVDWFCECGAKNRHTDILIKKMENASQGSSPVEISCSTCGNKYTASWAYRILQRVPPGHRLYARRNEVNPLLTLDMT